MARRKAIRFSIWSAIPLASRVGILHFVDIQLDRAIGHGLESSTEPLGFGALAADDHAGACGVDVHDQTVASPLDVDARNRASEQLVRQVLADSPVFVDECHVILLGEPLRFPVSGNS
jgi:hypothetical protein